MSAPVVERPAPRPQGRISRPRRVCLVTEAAGGGVGRHFLDLAAGLASLGVEVVAIFSPGRCDASFRERRAVIAGVRFVELPMRRALHPLDAVDLRQLVAVIRDEGPFDLIHGHSSKGGALARLAARWLGIPSIYTPHAIVTLDPTSPFWKRRLYGQVERWLARHTAAIIAVSGDEAAHARELRIAATKIHVVHNGIELLDFPPRDLVRSRLGLSADDFAVGFVGRLVPQKAPDLLVEAFAILAQQSPRSRLVIVGSGPLEVMVRRRTEELQLTKHVMLLGDVVATSIMPAFDVFCLSSRYEGMPYVLLEALAAGLPIVATPVGGVTTCVDSGENGFIVKANRASELAAALACLAADPPFRQRLAAASQRKATQFSVSRMIEQTLAVYEQVVSRVFSRAEQETDMN